MKSFIRGALCKTNWMYGSSAIIKITEKVWFWDQWWVKQRGTDIERFYDDQFKKEISLIEQPTIGGWKDVRVERDNASE